VVVIASESLKTSAGDWEITLYEVGGSIYLKVDKNKKFVNLECFDSGDYLYAGVQYGHILNLLSCSPDPSREDLYSPKEKKTDICGGVDIS
jgi:uncharacterized protein YuzE